MSLHRLGRLDKQQVQQLAGAHAAQDSWKFPDRGCPWHQSLYWSWMWEFRQLIPVEEPVRDSMRKLLTQMNVAGTDRKNSPMGLIDAAGLVDVPESRELALRLLPVVLRRQNADGGWGADEEDVHDTSLGASVAAFRLLKKHGLLEPLRAKPGMPSSWRIGRTIPAPDNVQYLAYDGSKFLTYQKEKKDVVAVDVRDGKELARSPVPSDDVQGLAFGDERILVADREAKTLLRLNPGDGSVETLVLKATKWKVEWVNAVVAIENQAYIFDPWWPWLWQVGADGKCRPHAGFLPGNSPRALAGEGGTIWLYDQWSRSLIRSKLDGEVIEYHDNPLESDIDGLAFDGKNLWVLEAGNRRICMLERVDSQGDQTRKRANVNRENGKAWIDGVGTLSWGKSSATTFASALEAALAATDHPYSTADIMGYSGLAFRVRWGPREKGWCPSVPVGEFPEERAAVSEATGWRFTDIDEMEDETDPRMGRYADQMAAAIDSGMPVVGYPKKLEALNVAVAMGYEGSGADLAFLWQTYGSGVGTVSVPVAETGPWIMIPKEYHAPPADKERVADAMRIAVRNWHRRDEPKGDGYFYLWGETALKAWHDDLRDLNQFDEGQQQAIFFANWWCFSVLVGARGDAVQFLNAHAAAFEGEARNAMKQAAALYEKEHALLAACFETKNAFLGPWSGKKYKNWDDAILANEREILVKALELESTAVKR